MPSLVFDLETLGEDFDKMDQDTKNALTDWVYKKSDKPKEQTNLIDQIKKSTGLSPFSGKIISIALLNPKTLQGAVYFLNSAKKFKPFTKKKVLYQACLDEKEIIKAFWKTAIKYDQFITYNGNSFDVPFLFIRSAINKIRPKKNLMSNRYLNSQLFDSKHVDLLDQLTFYGAFFSRPKLHTACRAFGIKSPKYQGVNGDDVKKLYQKKLFLEIAKYNVRDVIATAELFNLWEKYLKF
jgi:DNA polymerase elongation subunit (family B)